MILYPKGYFNKVSEITIEYLQENQIKGLILDVDNTLIDFYKNLSPETIEWATNLKNNDIRLCILSNSNKEKKVKEVANKLKIAYIHFGLKPFKKGFKRALNLIELKNDEVAVVGDQIFTDVLGANRMKMFSILVDPIEKKDIWVTIIKRPIENYIKKQYIKNMKK